MEDIPTSSQIDRLLQHNLRLHPTNHIAFTSLTFMDPIRDMSEATEFAQRVARLVPKTIASLIAKGNEDTYFQIQNNGAYHLPMDLVNAYVSDFVNRHVFHCVHFWETAIPAPGVVVTGVAMPAGTLQEQMYFSLMFDIAAYASSQSRVLNVKIGVHYKTPVASGFATYYKTDRIAV